MCFICVSSRVSPFFLGCPMVSTGCPQVNKATASSEQLSKLLRGVCIDDGAPARALSVQVRGYVSLPHGEKVQILVPWV